MGTRRAAAAAKASQPFVTGYIEGYYGRYLSWAERADLIARLAENGGMIYLLAPKEDPFHRQQWREPYPASWLAEAKALVREARALGVEVSPGMAPGLSFDYTSEQDYRALLGKFRAFLKIGCRRLALLMDDIPAVLPEASRGRFATLGEAHGRLLSRLNRDLGMGATGENLWFCPTVYCDDFSQGGPAQDPYLRDLAVTAPEKSPLFWTGPGIISRRLKPSHLKPLQKLFPGRVMLWDNLYANDYCPHKIFLGPFAGRPAGLKKNLAGLLLNPTGLLETDKLYLDLLGAWSRGKPAKAAWREAMAKAGVPAALLSLTSYLNLPLEKLIPSALSAAARQRARKRLKPLIWNWKAPIQREWYPYLFMLDADLRLGLTGKEAPDEAWLRKRYSPLLAETLLLSKPLRKLPGSKRP